MKSIKNSIRFLINYLKDYKLALLWQIFCATLSGFISIAGTIGLQFAIVSTQNNDLTTTAIICGTILGIFCFNWLFQYSQYWINARIAQRISKKIRNRLFTKLNKLPISFFDKHPTGDIMSRFINDANNISIFLSDNFSDLIGVIVWLVGMGIALYVISWSMALITTLLFIISIWIIVSKIKKSIPFFDKLQKTLGEFTGLLEEKIAGQTEIDLFEQQDVVRKEFDAVHKELYDLWEQAQLTSIKIYPVIDFLININTIIILSIAVLFVLFNVPFMNFNIAVGSQSGAVATLTIFVLLARNFLSPLNQLPSIVNIGLGTNVGIQRIEEVFNDTDEYNDFEKLAILISMDKNKLALKNEDKVEDFVALQPSVEFKHVDFNYLENEPVLQDINFKIKAGQFIGVVGPTGSGKTTIINLLSKMYEPTKGEILIDNVSTKKINRDSLRKNISTVLQDTFFFNLSIKDNIRLANANATDDEIIEACKKAYCHEIITNLPDGYETIVNSNFSELSKGQRQLIAIARAIITDANLVIFDEATSSVDVKTEALIQKAMADLLKNKTAILIAHRLSTIRNADNILVVNKGKLIEQGNHEELLKLNGFYAKLHNSQFDIID